MTAPCAHGMPSPSACVDCMYEGNVAPRPLPEPESVQATTMARYEGQCPACDLPITNGQVIAHTTRDRWIHEECAR